MMSGKEKNNSAFRIHNSELNVPEIRFNGFNGEWAEKELGEITLKIGSGKTPKGGDSTYVLEGVPLIRSQNIYNNLVNLNNVAYITPQTHEEMKNSSVYQHDVLLNITGASIGRSAVYTFSSQANVNQHVCIIRLKNGYNSAFTQLHLVSSKGQQLIDNNQAGGAREGLNFQQIGKMQFSFSSAEEQTQIGNYFQKLDNLINQHQQKHDKLSSIKKAMLEKMFPKQGETIPEIRFKGFGGEWVEKKIKDLTDQGLSNGVFNDPQKVGKGYRLINVKDMFSGDSINVDSLSLVDIDEKEFKNNKVEYGDIFFTRSSLVKEGIAYSNVNLSDRNDLTFDGHLIRMQPCKTTTDPIFLSYLFKTSSARQQFILGGKTTTMTTIGQNDIAVVDLALPEKPEQTKIGNYFQKLDALINQHQQQITKLNNIKQACLSKMFV